MKIGIVCYPSIGGSGLIATSLGLKLAELGHEVHFISYDIPFKLKQFTRNVIFHSVDPINYPLFGQSLYTFSLTAKIIEVAEEYELDIVHAHYSLPHSLCAHLAREISSRDFRIVTTLHGTDVTIVGQHRPLYPINRYGIQQSDAITTVSHFQRQHTLRHFHISRDIEVIYNFIDPEVFQPHPEMTTPGFADPDDFIIMHISNFREPKNPRALVEAFNLAVRRQPRCLLVLVGDGPEVTTIRTRVVELGIASRVRHLGKVDNVETVLPYAHCVFLPSLHESFGMVLLEAMACAIPTVSSNVDGIPEVVVARETGLLASPDDYAALADCLVELCCDTDLCQAFGEAGRKRALDCFSVDRMIPRYLAVYQRLLG